MSCIFQATAWKGSRCSVKLPPLSVSLVSRTGLAEGTVSAVPQNPCQVGAFAPEAAREESPTRFLKSVLVLAILTVISFSASAQTPTGTLRGQVTDPSGAVVTNAQVSAVGPAGQTLAAKSSANGTYEIDGLPPGQYTITA